MGVLGMKIGDPDWLTERQHQYMRLMAGGEMFYPPSSALMDLHSKVVKALDKLPVSSGGMDTNDS
jgi:hypothetical protein